MTSVVVSRSSPATSCTTVGRIEADGAARHPQRPDVDPGVGIDRAVTSDATTGSRPAGSPSSRIALFNGNHDGNVATTTREDRCTWAPTDVSASASPVTR